MAGIGVNSDKGFPKVVLFEPEIVFAVIVMSEVIVKEVNCHENTGHVTYIEAGEKCERKADNKKLKLFFVIRRSIPKQQAEAESDCRSTSCC